MVAGPSCDPMIADAPIGPVMRWTFGRVAALVSLTVVASAFAFTNVMLSPQLPAVQKEFGLGPGVVSLVLVALSLPHDRPVPTGIASNVRGFVATSLGVLCLLLPLLSVRWVRDPPAFGVVGLVIGATLLATSKTSREMLAPN